MTQTKEQEKQEEEQAVAEQWDEIVREWFDEREFRLIRNAMIYAQNDPAGLPGHNLMVIIDKLCRFLGFAFPSDLEEKWVNS